MPPRTSSHRWPQARQTACITPVRLLERLADDDSPESDAPNSDSLSPRRAFFSGLAGLTPSTPFRNDFDRRPATTDAMAPKNKNKNRHRDNKAEPEKKVDDEAEKVTESGEPETLAGTGESTLALPLTRGKPPPRAGHDEGEWIEGEFLKFGAILSFYCFSRPSKPHLHFMRVQIVRAHPHPSSKHTPQTPSCSIARITIVHREHEHCNTLYHCTLLHIVTTSYCRLERTLITSSDIHCFQSETAAQIAAPHTITSSNTAIILTPSFFTEHCNPKWMRPT